MAAKDNIVMYEENVWQFSRDRVRDYWPVETRFGAALIQFTGKGEVVTALLVMFSGKGRLCCCLG